jgi:Ca2+-binding EF-hand superfamily protein
MREMNERLDEKVIEAMFRAADRNNDGRINFQEFVKMMNE